MEREKIINKIQKLAEKTDSAEASAVLYTLALAMHLNKEKLMFDTIKNMGYNTLLPEAHMLAEASDEVREFLKSINMN